MASPQPTDSHTRISNELFTEILMRDFTKRHRAILDLIIRLSYGCGKKTAYIRMSQFIICGVDKYHIKKELKSLHKLNVIGWNESECEFWIQKDYELWKIEPPSDEVRKEMNFLIRENIKDSYQNGNTDSETSYQNGNRYIESYQNGNQPVTKTVTKELPKWEPEKPETSCAARLERVPITKDNYKEIEKININNADDVDTTCRSVDQTMSECLGKVFIAKRDDYMNIKNLLTSGVPSDVIVSGIRESFLRNRNVRSFSYCVPIIKELWEIELAKQAPAELITFTPKRTSLSALDEFKRRKGITDDDRQRDREIVLNFDGSISET